MAVLPKFARRAGVVAAVAGLSCLGALSGASEARAQPYPPGGGTFVVSTTLVIAGGQLTFTATLPFGQPIVVELTLPTWPLPGQSPSASPHAHLPAGQDTGAPQTLTTLVPDARGHVSGSVTIPQGTLPGDRLLRLATTQGHHVLAATPLRVLPDAPAGTVSARIGVQSPDARPLQAAPTRTLTKPLLAAGAMTVGTGLGGWALRRRRPHRED